MRRAAAHNFKTDRARTVSPRQRVGLYSGDASRRVAYGDVASVSVLESE